MKIWRNSAALALIGIVLISAGLPALGQDAPESLLPPGFDDPVTPAPSPRPSAWPTPRPDPARPDLSRPIAPLPPSATLPRLPGAPTPSPTPGATPGAPDEADAPPPSYVLPENARRSLARVGVASASAGGLPANAFGATDGRMLEALMRRIDAPIASRWLSIALRRTLVSQIDTPADLNGADFAAERAWLLIRMGEAHAARAVVQSVDVENYTPKLFQIAMQAGLASADPGAVCPLVEPAIQVSNERGWVLARAMCTALQGNAAQAGSLIDAARRSGVARGIDLTLAEKVLSRGAQGRRDVTIEWDGVTNLTAWRYGLATATGQEIPAALYGSVGPQVRLWQALAPTLAPLDRLDAAELAAAQGVLSSAAYIDLFGMVEESEDGATAAGSIARDLRTANIAAAAADRLTILRTLWAEPRTPLARYARKVLTAGAAARVTPDPQFAGDTGNLVAAMLTAGYDLRAMRWRAVVPRGSDGWAMLVVANPRPAAQTPYSDIEAYRGAASNSRKAQMLFAGLAALGRMDQDDVGRLAQALEVPIDQPNSWTRAIDEAARRREPATVVLLGAAGMQTSDWGRVPPVVLYHLVAAMRATGLEAEARMIAAEAIARL